MTVRLFHGTNEHAWRSMQAAGAILPRRLSGASNWDHTIQSHPNCVYLTDTYAPYFGVLSITDAIINSGDEAAAAIIELNVDAIIDRLVPDEDALEQSTRTGKISNTKMLRRTRKARATLHTHQGSDAWRDSLAFMGNGSDATDDHACKLRLLRR